MWSSTAGLCQRAFVSAASVKLLAVLRFCCLTAVHTNAILFFPCSSSVEELTPNVGSIVSPIWQTIPGYSPHLPLKPVLEVRHPSPAYRPAEPNSLRFSHLLISVPPFNLAAWQQRNSGIIRSSSLEGSGGGSGNNPFRELNANRQVSKPAGFKKPAPPAFSADTENASERDHWGGQWDRVRPQVRQYTLSYLQQATGNFSRGIGEGNLAKVFVVSLFGTKRRLPVGLPYVDSFEDA